MPCLIRDRPLSLYRLVCLAAAFALLAGGCKRPAEQDANRIQFSFWGSVQQQRAEEELIQAFRKAHPEIEVDIMVIGARYPEKIQAMFVGGVAPDVVMVNLFVYDEWASRGVLLDLTDEFEEIDRESEVLPIPRRAVERDGRMYGIPINAHGIITFHNNDALQAAGVDIPEGGFTWDYLEEIAPRLSRRGGNPDAPTDYMMLMPPPAILFWQHGVQFFDDLFHPTKATVNTPEAAEAVRLLRRFRDKGFAVPPEVAADEGTFQLFRDRRVAFYFNGRWLTPEFAGRTNFDWEVSPLPSGPVSNITQHGGTVLSIWADSPRKEAAQKFLKFYASHRGAAISMHWQRNVPVFRDLAFGDEFLDLRPPANMVHFSETMEDGASQFPMYAPGVQEVMRIFTGHIERALSRPEISAERIVAAMEDDFNRWLDRMRSRGFFIKEPDPAAREANGPDADRTGG